MEEEDGEFTANDEDGKILNIRCKGGINKYWNNAPVYSLKALKLVYVVGRVFIFCFFSFSAEDEEDTIAAQEKVEGNVNHAEELDDLAKEGRCFFYYWCIK